jgi:hypothetical protein
LVVVASRAIRARGEAERGAAAGGTWDLCQYSIDLKQL